MDTGTAGAILIFICGGIVALMVIPAMLIVSFKLLFFVLKIFWKIAFLLAQFAILFLLGLWASSIF